MKTIIVGDIDVSGNDTPADPQITETITEGVARLRAVIEQFEVEHPRSGLDVLLSCYVSLAVERIGIERTKLALRNTYLRLILE